jgi:putative phosphoribosyl transferase
MTVPVLMSQELGLGAVVDGHDPQLVLNEELVRAVAPPPGYIEAEEQRQLAEIERRRRQYIGDRSPVAVEGRIVIVVDDGIATGATVKAALRGLARNHRARLVLAVPCRQPTASMSYRPNATRSCAWRPPTRSMRWGRTMAIFRQTEDAEVVRLLAEARQWSAVEPSTPAPPR